jgi:hypothetical protein
MPRPHPWCRGVFVVVLVVLTSTGLVNSLDHPASVLLISDRIWIGICDLILLLS